MPGVTMAIHVFFHVARMGSFWREVVESVCGSLDGSGVSNEADGLHCVTVGEGEVLFNYLSMDHRKWSVTNGGHLWEFEYPTLVELHQHSIANPGDYVLYIHTKGVREEQGDRWFRGQWRRWMMWHVVTRWRECVKLLDEGYDTVGAWWHTEPHPHYAGNFWWARCDYVAKLQRPAPVPGDQNVRVWAEFWVGSNKPKHFDFGPPLPTLRAEYYGKIYDRKLVV